MEISVFKKAKAHPASTDEKKEEARYCVDPDVMTIKDEQDLFEAVTSYAWSPSIFNGRRCKNNFVRAHFMAVDIDAGLTIEEAIERCDKANLSALIAPTVSHTKEHHKFRVIFPLVKSIGSSEVYHQTWEWIREKYFPELDVQCSDESRFYYGCICSVDGEDECRFLEGDFLVPRNAPKLKGGLISDRDQQAHELVSTTNLSEHRIYEYLYDRVPPKIPSPVAFFFENAYCGMPGEWICALNSCVYTLALQGLPYTKVFNIIKAVAPEKLDDKDLYQIKRAHRDGLKTRADNEETEE